MKQQRRRTAVPPAEKNQVKIFGEGGEGRREGSRVELLLFLHASNLHWFGCVELHKGQASTL